MSVAPRLASLARKAVGAPLPVRLIGWDGSVAGPEGAPAVRLHHRDALRHLLWAPGELGLARAYVSGQMDIDGDVLAVLRTCWTLFAATGRPRLRASTVVSGAWTLTRLGAIGPRPRPPASEARLAGRRHSRRRDAAATAHHYDLSNALYALLLDEHMAYSCGYWTGDGSAYTLADAQRDKLDLICRKLDLGPGRRLLDVGCGWGALAVHAATRYGASVIGVTLSAEQAAFARERVAVAGARDLVEIRHSDYRDITDGPFDAISAIEMGEHVGKADYPSFLATLHRLLPERGRVLIQQMSRHDHPGGGPFIERYIAPDMHMRPLPETLALVEAAGFEIGDVQPLREHYVRTIDAWREQFEHRYDEVVALVGEEQARVWRLYLAGGLLTFEQGRMGVDQILAVKTATSGDSGLPPTRLGWEPHAERRATV